MPETVVLVEEVGKKFCRSVSRGMRYAAADIAGDLLGVSRDARLRHGEFWAVREVSLEVKQGECLGVIGANGAGKSTLLKLLTGVLLPDRGRIRIRGRLGALIEVGAGFHPMLTGRENVYVNGAILGMARREIDRRLETIVEFSGLPREMLDAPVKTYSSGQYVRLGFSVAAHSDPDVLLVDEVLSVGDLQFVGKCRRHIEGLLERGAAVVYVSHRLNEVRSICNRALLLQDGAVSASGDPAEVIEAYRREVELSADTSGELPPGIEPGLAGPRLGAPRLTGPGGHPVDGMEVGGSYTLEVPILDDDPAFDGELRVSLQRRSGSVVVATAAVPWEAVRDAVPPGLFVCHFRMLAMPGEYDLHVSIRGPHRYDYLDLVSIPAIEVQPGTATIVPAHSVAYTVLDLQRGPAP